jgi:choline dehydrogenase-like flavoprotein
MSWRFYPEDFAMASTYGVPEHSTLADWPFDYDELAPYYDRVEWELGVSGSGDSPMGLRAARARGYPMPALPSDKTREAFSAAAAQLGWSTSPIPFAINSVPRDGRPACVRCAQCVGHSCPVNAKNGTQNTFIPRAIATGNCDLLLSAQALAIEHDASGTATGVQVVVETADGPVTRVVRSTQVVVSAGAIESARLLLVSGLGNDWVGRNHHSHGVAAAIARAAPDVKSWIGPGHSIASVDWVHRNREAWGGGVIFDFPPMYPLGKAELGRNFAGAAWGVQHKEWMRDTGSPVGTLSMVQEIPHEASRVTIDQAVTDRWGMPVARLRGEAHPATREAVDYMTAKCEEWLAAVGGRDIFEVAVSPSPQGSEHSAGTARMAAEPRDGACDGNGLLFGTRNVYVADASLHPTNGGFNPGLTAMANALRVADLLSR